MPFDGSGNYTPAAAPNFPAVAGTTINSTYYNAVINDLATALSNTLTKDGQGKPSVNFNWNGKNLTNVNALEAVTGAFTGAVTMSSSLAVTGTLSVTGTSSHTGAATFGSNVTASGRIFGGGLTSTTVGAEGGELHLQSIAGGNGFLIDVSASDVVRFYNYNSTDMIFSQNNGAFVAMRILANGNIGINNNAPATKLDVGGTLNASGAVTFGSTLNVTGVSNLSSLNLTTPLSVAQGGTGRNYDPTPVGKIDFFLGNTAPTGWLELDGSAKSRTTYAALWAYAQTCGRMATNAFDKANNPSKFYTGDGSTTFDLPDFRGMFIRSWDHGRGVDTGRAIGAAQADLIKNHTHTLQGQQLSGNGILTGNTVVVTGGAGLTDIDNTTGDNASGGAETRPVNVAALVCVKY